MSRSSKIYTYVISIVGLALGSYCVYSYLKFIINSANPRDELLQFGLLFVLYIICRCLPIYIRNDYAIDMSFICNLAAILCKGSIAAAAMVLISTPFILSPMNTGEKRFSHIFNKPPIQTTFNAANFTISVFVSGVLYERTGGLVGYLVMPRILFPSILAIFTFFILNRSILFLSFPFYQKTPYFTYLFKNLFMVLPNLVVATPIAYFIAKIMIMQNGKYLVILITMHLLLAGYSYVLYIESKRNYYDMVKTLTAALEAKDQYTEGHSHRVEGYAEMIACKMRRSQSEIENIKVAALLHDLGKIGIDDKILNKPGPLTPEERKIIMTHPQISASILKDVKLNKAVREAILHHHERYDGGGYPDKTKRDENSIEAYIIGVADAYDAMTSDRPYCSSMPVQQVVGILKEESGKQFHPKVVAAFLEVLHDTGEI